MKTGKRPIVHRARGQEKIKAMVIPDKTAKRPSI